MTAGEPDTPGLLELPARLLAMCRPSRRIEVGSAAAGRGMPVPARSMTTTPTSDIDVTSQRIAGTVEGGGIPDVRVS
jgi:(E)-4-hydroxy-3-methylbut-2-enyl-diphosphate synthase